MSLKPIDSYIKNSISLFESNPSQSLISITYRAPNDKDSSLVTFKTHNSHLGSNYKFKTNKSKDVSRLLNALGPRGVSIARGKIERRYKNQRTINGNKPSKNNKKKNLVIHNANLGTLLANTEVKEYVPPVVNEKSGSNIDTSSKNKKKNKKKNNKKR